MYFVLLPKVRITDIFWKGHGSIFGYMGHMVSVETMKAGCEQYVNECMWLCSYKTLFMKVDGRA